MAQRKEQWDKDAYGLEEAKEIWGNVAGTINYMDLGFKARKPDWKKLGALMKKAGKPAKYFMTMDGLVYTFEVHVGSKKMVLNKVDFGRRKAEDQRDVLRKLNFRTKIVTKADLEQFDRAHADPEDGKEAVEINEQIDRLENEIAWLRQTAKAGNYRKKTIDTALFMEKEFLAWAKKKGFQGFTDFLLEIDDDRGWSARVVAFVKTGKKTGLRDSTLAALLKSRASGKTDWTQARKEVARVVNRLLLPKYNKEGLRRIADEIKDKENQVKKLERELKALKAA